MLEIVVVKRHTSVRRNHLLYMDGTRWHVRDQSSTGCIVMYPRDVPVSMARGLTSEGAKLLLRPARLPIRGTLLIHYSP